MRLSEYPPQFLRGFQEELENFKSFLTANGALIQSPTNEWEVLRFEHGPGVTVIYRDKHNGLTWSPTAKEAWKRYSNGEPLPASERVTRRSKAALRLDAVITRDGNECFYCGRTDVELTLEHLLALNYGGTNHLANLVAACQPCNHEAGCQFIIDKVELREKKRGVLRAQVSASAVGVA